MYPPHASSEFDEPWAAPGGPPSQQSNEPIPEIFIGRVPPNVSKEALEVHFAPYGATNFRVLEGKGCAFCSFSTWAAAESAIQALNGLKIDGGAGEGINVKLADVKGAPKGSKLQQTPKVFIGNIALHATEDAVREACQQYGVVTYAKIFSKNDSKPCAFVTFSSFSEAEVCISSLNGMEHPLAVDGKVLNVRLADAMNRKAGGPPGSNSIAQPPSAMHLAMPTRAPQVASVPLPFGPPGGRTAPMQRAPQMPPQGMMQMQQSIARPSTMGGVGPKIFIGGLPESATEDFVWGMMAPFGDVTEAKIHRKAGAKPCGFARFATAEQADSAMAVLANNGRFAIRPADDSKGPGKRPLAIGGIPGLAGLDQEMYGGGRAAVRRLH